MEEKTARPNFLLASVSPYASDSETAGHYYWMYHHLQQMQGSVSVPLTAGLLGRDAHHIVALLSPRRPRKRSHIGKSKWRKKDEFEISQWLEGSDLRNVTHVQCYDGTVRDLYVIEAIARKFPKVVFIFNFHWAVEWIQISDSRSVRERILKMDLADLLSEAPANLMFSAETVALANKLSSAWGVPISAYPVFTMHSTSTTKPWAARKMDVLFIPQRAHEVQLCIEVSALLRDEGLKVSLGLTNKLMSFITSSKAGSRTPPIFDQVFDLPLTEPNYKRMIESHRVVVLPYLKEYFKWGSSGKFNDAIALGAFPMVPDETAIATQSNLGPLIHQFPATGRTETRNLILERLASGFPLDLKAVGYQDFVKWANIFRSERLENPRSKRRPLLGLVGAFEFGENLAAFLFRNFRSCSDNLYHKAKVCKPHW